MSGEWVLYPFWGVGLSVAVYTAAALIHEGGHALAGYFFKAKCLWVRVGGMLWVPEGGIFVRAKSGIRPGECVLLCPDRKSCIGAAFGGSAANFITGLGAGLIWLFQGYSLWLFHPLLFVSVAAFSVCSFGMGFLNLIPNAAGAKNDGTMVKRLCHDKEFYKNMQRNQQRDLIRLEFGILEEMF